MKEVEVNTQAELEKVCAAGDRAIVRNGIYTAYDSSQVTAYDSSQVTACDSSQVTACGSSQVTACGSSQVTAYGSSQVTACDSSQVTACDSSQVRACDSSQVTAYDSSQVRAYDSSQVTAYDSSQVTACDSSQVTACGSSQVTACGSSQVTAYGSSQVTACDSSQVTACDSSQVRASKQVAVTVHGKPKVSGGVQIKYKGPRTAKQWIENYGLKAEKGVVILYKIVRADWKSRHGTSYAPGTMPKADDWDGGEAECGGGLHFCPMPCMCYQFDSEGTKFVACPVKVSEIAVHADPQYPTKIKAPRVCAPTWEVDINGNKIEAKPCAKS